MQNKNFFLYFLLITLLLKLNYNTHLSHVSRVANLAIVFCRKFFLLENYYHTNHAMFS